MKKSVLNFLLGAIVMFAVIVGWGYWTSHNDPRSKYLERCQEAKKKVEQNLPLNIAFRVLAKDTGELSLKLKNNTDWVIKVCIKKPFTAGGYTFYPTTDSIEGMWYDMWIAANLGKMLKSEAKLDAASKDSLDKIIDRQVSTQDRAYELLSPNEYKQRDSFQRCGWLKEDFSLLFEAIATNKSIDLP